MYSEIEALVSGFGAFKYLRWLCKPDYIKGDSPVNIPMGLAWPTGLEAILHQYEKFYKYTTAQFACFRNIPPVHRNKKLARQLAPPDEN